MFDGENSLKMLRKTKNAEKFVKRFKKNRKKKSNKVKKFKK